jgi:hypothetical protein
MMEYRNLGASGLKVPAFSFGTGTFGGEGPLLSPSSAGTRSEGPGWPSKPRVAAAPRQGSLRSGPLHVCVWR